MVLAVPRELRLGRVVDRLGRWNLKLKTVDGGGSPLPELLIAHMT
jgi:hypothetical protein